MIDEDARLTNPQLVTVAVANLGGETETVDVEDIALEASRLAPERFCWRKYRDRVDLEAVRVALRDAKKECHGAMLIGNSHVGWMLSPQGIRWIASGAGVEPDGGTIARFRRGSIDASLSAEASRIRRTRAYVLHQAGRDGEISLDDVYELARLNEYFPPLARKRRLAILDNVAAEDEGIAELWILLQSIFRRELAR
ncbi:MAG: hypothetical protein ABFD20_10495 [Anaerolineales bacterium]